MLVLVGVVSTAAALYAEAGWSRTGAAFHPLFQIQLLGLNGVFLTGDLFNLFVFFEVLLGASYGLQLHGSGWTRVRAGMHYIAIRSEEHTSELQSLMRISYAVFCLIKNKNTNLDLSVSWTYDKDTIS